MELITNSKISFINKLKPHLSIEVETDVGVLKNSNKGYISWNPTARSPDNEIWQYRKQHNKPSYFVERGALPNTVVIDRNGFLVDSSSYQETNWNKELTWEQYQQIVRYVHDLTTSDVSLELQDPNAAVGFDVRADLQADNKEIIFIPMQLNTDTVIKQWSDWVGDVHRFQSIVIKLAQNNPDKLFLVKNHPIGQSKPMPIRNNIVSGDKYHYKSCLACADKAIVINSGVGLQAMAWQVPTIIVGHSFYTFEGINYKANNYAQLDALVNQSLSFDEGRSLEFLYFLKYVLYSDCVLVKKESSRHRNKTDQVDYTNVRIFQGQ